MFFGTKSHYTILSNYVTIFCAVWDIYRFFKGKIPENSAHWLQWVRNYWYCHFSPNLVMFLRGVGETQFSKYVNKSYLPIELVVLLYLLVPESLIYWTRWQIEIWVLWYVHTAWDWDQEWNQEWDCSSSRTRTRLIWVFHVKPIWRISVRLSDRL